MTGRQLREPERCIPVVGEYDVVVAGGGIAGVAAAIAAAREGATTCLVEKENAVGGLATLGLVEVYLPLCDGRGRQVIGGLAEDLLLNSVKYGPGQVPECWANENGDIQERSKQRYRLIFNPASFVISLEEQLLQAGVQVMYDTRVCNVLIKEGYIEALIVENKSGRLALRATNVVDASGDADVCSLAGESTVSLDTNRRAGWFIANVGGRTESQHLSDPLYKDPPPGAKTYSGDCWEDVTEMSIVGRRMILKRIDHLRQQEGYDKVYPLVIPTIPLFRMTRRLEGAFELDEADDKRFFPDAIGMTGDWRKPGPIFYIPYRCLLAVQTKNLIAAGRCISVTTSAWDITRAIPTCAVTGEAAGMAAAMSARTRQELSRLDPNDLQSQLKEHGVIIDKPDGRI
ncbi:MAG: FAD-dependent oxidoreductase [Limnochordia bacterium]